VVEVLNGVETDIEYAVMVISDVRVVPCPSALPLGIIINLVQSSTTGIRSKHYNSHQTLTATRINQRERSREEDRLR
jgi:hypothetical protein